VGAENGAFTEETGRVKRWVEMLSVVEIELNTGVIADDRKTAETATELIVHTGTRHHKDECWCRCAYFGQ
jgi:hypothetical protein